MNLTSSDEELMLHIGNGDVKSYEILVKRHLHSSFRLVQRLIGQECEAEDIVQEAFMKVWQRAKLWQPNAKFKTWFHQILVNRCIDWQRAQTYRNASQFIDKIDYSHEHSVEKTILEQEKQYYLKVALQALSEKEKAAIVLHYYQGFSQQEVGEILNISVSAVETMLYRTRLHLQKQLESLLSSTTRGYREHR
ncbi:MAG: RNA polymerase sigma factor [Candidatus Berkiellales bacterium]